MKLSLAFLAGYPIAWLLSALLHSTDADYEGLVALATPSALVSVSVIALFFYIPCIIALLSFALAGRWGYGLTLLGMAAVTGAIVALLGSSAPDMGGKLFSFGAMTAICAIVFLVGTVPGLVALRRLPAAGQ